jgi:hypothetical protein
VIECNGSLTVSGVAGAVGLFQFPASNRNCLAYSIVLFPLRIENDALLSCDIFFRLIEESK